MNPPNNPGLDRQFRDHYSASQFRTETWNTLKNLTEKMRRVHERDGDVTHLSEQVAETLALLHRIEQYWAFPGRSVCVDLERLHTKRWLRALARATARVVRLLVSDSYRQRDLTTLHEGELEDDDPRPDSEGMLSAPRHDARPYFEVLIVDELEPQEEIDLRRQLREMRSASDEFVYDIVVVSTFEDAVVGALFNHNFQACVLRYTFAMAARQCPPELSHYVRLVEPDVRQRAETDPSGALADLLKDLRPELDIYKVTDETLGSVAASDTRSIRRVFYRQEDYLELHLSILKGVRERFEAPFFKALRDYSQKPTGVFHALPISRGKSITNSHWIHDMGQFYGRNIFLAETSSTTGGLDSLLQPTGPLKRAQQKMARAFGSRHSFFVTNGTSTANKIVTQALVRPGDLVLLSHDCHKSHPYALVLAGAQPVYLDAYPLNDYTMFGAVPLREIKRTLIELARAGKLDRVRMLLLTNCTFDGIVYDPERVMREVLAIKPDMIFLWDEAWFAFARAVPSYRRRTGMHAAAKLRAELRSEAHQQRYAESVERHGPLDFDDDGLLERELLPDPARARVRVYATQSTHKTLTSLRQGSMIHVHDQDFEQLAHAAFHEAYMTHTSTSPNYQILASLDVGRRQLELEGYELVRNMIGLAMMIRKQITDHPLLSRWFYVLKVKNMIPVEHRPSGLERFWDPEIGFTRIESHWSQDEFALDPTRITLKVSATGMDGDTFRKMLMDRFDIQVNKTSRNTVLFMLNIGSTRGSATYLLDVLLQLAREFEERDAEQSELDRDMVQGRVRALADQLPPLPHFSRFHRAFVQDRRGDTREGDMRAAFFLAYDHANIEHIPLGDALEAVMASGRELVSAAFVTPYPPGFPVLAPGQVVTRDIHAYLNAIDVKEIHGYDPKHGLRVFKEEALRVRDAEIARQAEPTAQETAP